VKIRIREYLYTPSRVGRRSLENTFDPVTHALVDPDESVRAGAQELFEKALERQ
jgi:hypothetical protein